MPKARTKPKQPAAPVHPDPPIGMDVRRIEIALRALAGTAMRLERPLLQPDGSDPQDWPDTTIGQLIYAPIPAACRQAYDSLLIHLSHLIGTKATIELRDRINVEMRAAYPLPTAEPPSDVRH